MSPWAATEALAPALARAGLHAAAAALGLIVLAGLARRGLAPWRFAVLAAGLLEFAVPWVPGPWRAAIAWPALSLAAVPPSGAPLGAGWAVALGVWAAGAALQAARVVRGRLRLSRALRLCADPVPEAWWAEAGWAASRIGVPVPRLAISTIAAAPFVTGISRPVLALPRGWDAAGSDERRLALLHEMAHLARRDLWWIELAAWLSVVWWWHPLFWLLVRRLRAAQEDACDDRVLLAAPDAHDRYCAMLLGAARRAEPVPAPALAPASLGGPALEGRLRRLMDPGVTPVRGPAAAGVVGLALAISLALPGAAPAGPWAGRHDSRHHHRHHQHSLHDVPAAVGQVRGG